MLHCNRIHIMDYKLWLIVIICIIIRFKIEKTHHYYGKNVIQLIREFGYPIERHRNVQTPDGYLLELHRIPHGKNNSNSTNKPVVLLMHCFLCSSAEWLYAGPSNSLACILADSGYDVWLGNYRGNTWSRKHIKYNPSEDKFWNFSFHEHGIYDVPTMIDYALMITNQTSLYYIGFSQGSLTFFVMASEIPEYNKKIRFMTALGPVAYFTHIESPIILLMKLFQIPLEYFLQLSGIYEFMPQTNNLKSFAQIFCNSYAPTETLCHYIVFLLVGFSYEQRAQGLLPVITTHTPAGSSLKALSQFLQFTKASYFGRYDYGPDGNIIKYNTTEVPKYNLSKVTTPVGLFYGANDWLASVTDVRRLQQELSNVTFDYLVPHKDFNHMDFLWAKDVVTLVYDKVIEVIKKH